AAADVEDGCAGGGELADVLAVALEDLHAQLVLEQPDLLADSGLRGAQGLGGGGDVQVAPDHFVDVNQLAQLHGCAIMLRRRQCASTPAMALKRTDSIAVLESARVR